MCGSQETTKELDSGIKIVLECFMETGDSILCVVCCELLRMKLQNK